jgi:hypothetical protein
MLSDVGLEELFESRPHLKAELGKIVDKRTSTNQAALSDGPDYAYSMLERTESEYSTWYKEAKEATQSENEDHSDSGGKRSESRGFKKKQTR